MKAKNTTKGNSLNLRSLTIMMTAMIFSLAIKSNGQTTTHGFRLIEKRFVKEVNADCYYYEHVKSGAKLFKIAAADDNKTFGIAFKTVPQSDDGIAHIMEHSVLNGSTNFPVKSPFDVLSKGSLKTFLNAFTSKDFTMYPFASMNDKDYFNLMHVYLDAVFNPLISSDARIMKQEGWHYELMSKDDPITYKGVVYNEMKGAYSSPTREMGYQVFKNLFPDNLYGYESGGYPTAIPNLTQKEFIAFHEKYYHPENSFILLYGNADLDKELEFIDKEYLSKYTKTGNKVIIADQKPFTAMKDVTAYYPLMEGTPTEKQTYLSLNIVAGHNTDNALVMAFEIICEVLFNQESAPGRLALEKAGIGQDVSASVSAYNQNIIRITVQNAEAADKQNFYDIVINTLKDAVNKGIDKKELQGIINRYEFQLREGDDAQKGISYMSQIQPGWFFADNPFMGLEYENTLTEIKKSLTTDYMEKIIQKYLLDNPHSLLLTMVPKPGMDKSRDEKTAQVLKTYKDKLTSTQIDSMVEVTNELIAFQKKEDSPEALATIPMLSLSDINPKATWFGCDEKQVGNTKVLYRDEFTNNIVYWDIYFDLKVLPQELIPYASLLANLLGMMDTEKYPYGDLNRELNIETGGFYTNLETFLENQDDDKMITKFSVSSKVMNDKSPRMFELATEILKNTKYSDEERLKSVLTRLQSQLDASMKRDGYGVASRRLTSYFTNRGVFNELTSGLDYYWFISTITRDFDKDKEQIINNLEKVAALLFTQENITVAITCDKKDYENGIADLTAFIKTLPSGKPILQTWKFEPEMKDEGILTASKVQYVIAGYDFKKLGYSWDGKMRVLNQVLSTDWLKNQLRVIGGAYGGFSSVSSNGVFTFNSYRDPNLQLTINNYNATPDYLSKFEADETSMTRYIIGTISKLDVPLTAQQKGGYAVTYYFSKISQEMLQKERDAILTTKVADITAYSKMIKDILDQKAICVYGNTDKINAEKNSFKKLIKIDLP
jgi:presequence protease